MIADPFVQLRLLDLQAVDTALAQLDHRRRSLPELAQLAAQSQRAAAVRTELVDVETEIADLAAAQRRLENDIDTVRQRASKDDQRLASGGIPAKELSGLQHEVTSLARRQLILEDELLDLMESRETANAKAAALTGVLGEIAAETALSEAACHEVFGEIDDAQAKYRLERDSISATLPADLLGLYEKVAAASGGVGAAMLRHRQCEGCRLELAGNELADVRQAKPQDVLRCENCRRILIRTDESGL